MSKPNLGDAKVDKILTQFSQFYTNDSYIAEAILPPIKVKEKSGKYAKYGKENLRNYADGIYRAPGTRAHTVDYSVSQGTYKCLERSLEKGVPDEDYKNTDNPYDPERDATKVLMDNIWINQEIVLATTMANTAVLTNNTTLSGTSQWSDFDNSTPISDINTGIDAVSDAVGINPNLIVMSDTVWRKLKYHPDIREQLKYTGKGGLSNAVLNEALKDFFNVEEILVGNSIYNAADDGQSDDIQKIWGKHFWIGYRSKNPSRYRATFGATINDTPRYVDRYREDSHKRNILRIQYSYDQNLFDVNFMYLIKNAVA